MKATALVFSWPRPRNGSIRRLYDDYESCCIFLSIIRAQKHYGLFHCQTPPMSCGQFLVFVTQSTRTIANISTVSTLLFLEKYTLDSFVTIIGSTAYRPSLLGRARIGRITSVFNDPTAALSLSSSVRNARCWSFLNSLLSGGARRANLGTSQVKTSHIPEKKCISVYIVRFTNFTAASVVRSVGLRRLGRKAWPR